MSDVSKTWQIENRTVRVSHLEKVYWPQSAFTKGDMLRYYLDIASVALPHFQDRPVTLRVFPDGPHGMSFYQRERPEYAPSWLRSAIYHPRTATSGQKEPDPITVPLVNDAASLIWLANGGCVEFHLWSARVPHLDVPNQAIFDLDPGDTAPFSAVLEASLRVREHLERVGIACYAKTSGGRGIHIYAPLAPRYPYVDVRRWVRARAEELAAAFPRLIAVARGPTHRGDLVTVDYAQNSVGRNTAAPYTIRAGASQPLVSAPLSWDEMTVGNFQPVDLTPGVVLERIRRLGDLFAPVLHTEQNLPAPRP